MISKGALAARRLYHDFGLKSPFDVEIGDLVYGMDAMLCFEKMDNADGRIVFGKNNSIITINSAIAYEGRKRFTIAHELGHLVMHKDLNIAFSDDEFTLNAFQYGKQESEANDFANELLMPEVLFKEVAHSDDFSYDFLKYLANDFETSMTSVAYRYLALGKQPIYLIYCHDNIVKYWKKSDNMRVFVEDYTKLAPPLDSIASEYFRYGKHYKDEQKIRKSTWFRLNDWETADKEYMEYCIITPQYNTTLSVIWEV